tara:strand:- start:829 stop:1200 length:372 start_codon:yes stop_codon:yes gene_type:complete
MYKRKWLTLFIVVSMMCGVNLAYAATQNYVVQYDQKDSTVKGPSLKKATLVIQLYAHGNPAGKQTVTTNSKQSFTLQNRYGKRLVIDVISIKGSSKSIHCHGTVRGYQTTIQLVCHKRPEKHY